MGTAPAVPDIQQEKTVLKKAGIVVAAAAAGLLAVSPLAFAGESHGKSWGHGDVSSFEQNSEGLINVSDTNVNAPVNLLCNNDIPVNVGLVSSMIRASGTACRNCWGNTRSAPIIHAAYGTPHAFAWNIGTITSILSFSARAMLAVDVTIIECRKVLRWLYITPLGLPVVPLV